VQYNHGHRQHHDFNLKSADVHVIADRTTLALAIPALASGMLFDSSGLDPSEGWAEARVVGAWTFGPLKGTSRVPVDRGMDNALAGQIGEGV
jgi:Co/Zn/Cd efflux system component